MKLFGQNGPQLYNTLMSLHGMIMIISILLGIAGMINYVVPLMIGAQDMAFPRLNAFSFWIAVPAAVLMLMSLVLGGFDTGWTGYPPLVCARPSRHADVFHGCIYGWMVIHLGALNVIVTVVRMRSKAWSLFACPSCVWAAGRNIYHRAYCHAVHRPLLSVGDVPASLRHGFLILLKAATRFCSRHLFWFYSHPAVYVLFCRPRHNFRASAGVCPQAIVWLSLGCHVFACDRAGGFLVWAHHMFTSGMNEYLRVPFMYSTLLVAVPTGVKFFSWVATLWEG